MRISSSNLDDEIKNTMEACLLDMERVGIAVESQDKLMAVDTDTQKGQWYIKHSFNPYEGFSDLIRKGYRFLQQVG